MCRITGLVNGEKAIFDRMLYHQQRGGPDRTDYWHHGNITLGHNRLAIVDLTDTGNQPMEGNRWVLTYNGEIYDHHDLRQKLGPMAWKGTSDTETLLNCIEHKGIDWTLNNIEGMFSFAAYDKFEQKLHLAIDPFGIKPLYYYFGDNVFGFASSPGALTYLSDKWHIDLNALIDYLSLGATKQPLFSGINKLPGGHKLIIDCKTLRAEIDKYYRPQIVNSNAEQLLETVKHSIQSIKVADVPIFQFLSGGVDSTVVASQCENMPAIHLASPEETYARQVATKYHNPFIKIDPRDYNAEECLKDYSQQSGDCSMGAIIPYIVSKEASKYCKVAISSNGADELFFGYDRLDGDKITTYQINHIFRQYYFDISNWVHNDNYSNSRQLELSTYVEHDLNKTLDFASMCHGLEVRVPYLNRKVVEQALSIPWAEHTKNGMRPKAILKDFLVKEGFDLGFVTRPKLGFSLFYEPEGYNELKKRGINFLKEKFDIDPKLETARDKSYYAASAAAFLCWYETWESKLIL